MQKARELLQKLARLKLEGGLMLSISLDMRQRRAELVRLATRSGAEVEAIRAHEALLHLGRVGGLLCYDLAWV
ncbi:MAG TPA: hypothetical protein VFN35_19120 [Ktedonobacteraceae bacterium]|nr:hypothetical protein [Ktedonobacteraceae bacterium]